MKDLAFCSLTLENLTIRGDRGAVGDVTVLVDTGASVSMISGSLARRIATDEPADRVFNIVMGDGRPALIYRMVAATIEAGGKLPLTDNFYIMDTLVYDVILGVNTLRKYKMRIDLGTERITTNAAIAAPTMMDRKKVSIVEDNSPLAPAFLAAALGLPIGATEDDITRATLVRLREEAMIEDMVAAAIVPDAAGNSKLHDQEREWAIDFGRDNGTEVLASFIKHRQPITPAMRHLLARCAALKAEKEKPAAIDDVQRSINAQLGIDDATFLKYHR